MYIELWPLSTDKNTANAQFERPAYFVPSNEKLNFQKIHQRVSME